MLASGCDGRLLLGLSNGVLSLRHHQLLWAALIAVGALPVRDARSGAPSAPSSYRMITQYPIGGNDTGYDYLRLDAAGRIYLPTARSGAAPKKLRLASE